MNIIYLNFFNLVNPGVNSEHLQKKKHIKLKLEGPIKSASKRLDKKKEQITILKSNKFY